MTIKNLIKSISLLGFLFLSNLSFACYEATIQKPTPFMGNNGEVFILSDGSVWEVKYEYEYMYEYYPSVVICPDKNLLLIKGKKLNVQNISGGSTGGGSIIESYIDGDWGGLARRHNS